jgi:putative addiction module killer protein
VIGEWLSALEDARARARIVVRIDRLALGNFGDCKPLREGVWELRIDQGPDIAFITACCVKRVSYFSVAATSASKWPI